MGIEIIIGGSTCPFENKITIHVGFGINFEEIKTWCDDNCKGQWHNGMPNPAYWDFEIKGDAALFKLTWCDEGNPETVGVET